MLFEAPVASSLISHFVGAISGGALYRKASFLLDQVGQQIFPDFVQLYEQPLLKCAMGSAAYDSEGVTTSADNLITNGVLQRYLRGSYSAGVSGSRRPVMRGVFTILPPRQETRI
ncbi:MAG: hypothetical protein CM1200mP18_21310 [Gammaproteobacteria bacterium]|nr:MAG: hypothetical protein CM1200mP18_21310 [Gammaproteobacteria bacterium]